MADRIEYFECGCGSVEHTLRFSLDRDLPMLYTSIFLNDYYSFWGRLKAAVKYVFGHKCNEGHWDCWILNTEDVARLRNLLDELEKEENHG